MTPVRKLLAALLLLISLSACQWLFPLTEPDSISSSSEPIVTPAAGEATPRSTLPPTASENPILSPSIGIPPPIP